jgi:hypothetical protein
MEAADAVAIASLINLTDAKTPRLDAVHLDTMLEETVAYGTDRYVLGRYVATAGASNACEWQLSAAACKFITANVKPLNKWHTPEPVAFTVDTETRTVTIATNGATFADRWTAHGFKSSTTEELGRVLNKWEARTETQPVKLSTRLLVKLSKLMDGFSKSDAWILELGITAAGREDRPGPVRATNSSHTVLIMPQLMKS